ncbi:MAG: sugar phosphate isomerase/epimerase family protein [Butyricicoccus sp.]
MLQSLNFPLCESMREQYGGWDGLRADCAALGVDGVEGIWGGEDIPADFPQDLIVGYHLTFFPDWLDFYREDKTALCEKYGTLDNAWAFYGGSGPETLRKLYREDLARARKLGAKYVVFHVSDVSNEEGYTYRWLHTDREVIDASLELMNELLADVPPDLEFLVENQWWAGFTFMEPEKTAYLLEGIRYPRKGILLDTGHLMNTNLSLESEKDGVEYIENLLDRHADLLPYVRGMHLHQSLSGAYVRAHTGSLPKDFPRGDANAQFSYSYQHILQIDRHQPWTEPAVAQLIARMEPAYLTHELSAQNRTARMQAAACQIQTLRKGGLHL